MAHEPSPTTRLRKLQERWLSPEELPAPPHPGKGWPRPPHAAFGTELKLDAWQLAQRLGWQAPAAAFVRDDELPHLGAAAGRGGARAAHML